MGRITARPPAQLQAELRDGEQLQMLWALQVLLTQGWARDALARAKDGFEVHPLSPEACAWCLIGAIGKIAWQTDDAARRELRFDALLGAIAEVEPAVVLRTPAVFNDTETKEGVIAVVARAVVVEEQRLLR